MKISIEDFLNAPKNERLKWFILHLKKDWISEVFKNDRKELDIRLTINGVEVDPNEPINHVVENLEQFISSSAEKLIEEKLSGLANKLGNLRNKCDELESDLKFETLVGRKKFYEDD